jgi:hypothetical protein
MNTSAVANRPRFLAFDLLVYATSFFLPALGDLSGWAAFVYGLPCCVMTPFAILASGTPEHSGRERDWQWCLMAFSWAANPLLWIAYGSLARGALSWARRAGLAALAVALTVIISHGQSAHEALGPGYWLWVASMALVVVGAYVTEQDGPPARIPSDEFIREAL